LRTAIDFDEILPVLEVFGDLVGADAFAIVIVVV
jgi:hypothetical protein